MKKNKLLIAIVGLNFGKYIIEQIINGPGKDFFEIESVCDNDPKLCLNINNKYGIQSYTSIDELLTKTKASVIGLFTGPHTRLQLLNKLLDNDKHIITTKPFAFDYENSELLFNKALKKNLSIQLNSPSPKISPDLKFIQYCIDTYDLGRPVGIQASVWANYNEKFDNSWYDNPDLCPVAPITRLGIYLINDIVELLGKPTDLKVVENKLRTKRPTSDNASLSISFENNSIANIFSSFCINDGDPYRNSMIVSFENGTINRNVGKDKTDGFKSQLSLVKLNDKLNRKVVAEEKFPELSGDYYQWDEFYKNIDQTNNNMKNYYIRILNGVKILNMIKTSASTPQTDLMT